MFSLPRLIDPPDRPRPLTKEEDERVQLVVCALFVTIRGGRSGPQHERLIGPTVDADAATRDFVRTLLGSFFGHPVHQARVAQKEQVLDRTVRKLEGLLGDLPDAEAVDMMLRVATKFVSLFADTALEEFDTELSLFPDPGDPESLHIEWRELPRMEARRRQIDRILDYVDRQQGDWRELLHLRAAGWWFSKYTIEYADEAARLACEARIREWLRMEYVDPDLKVVALDMLWLDAVHGHMSDKAGALAKQMLKSISGVFTFSRIDAHYLALEHLVTKQTYRMWLPATKDFGDEGASGMFFGRIVPIENVWIGMESSGVSWGVLPTHLDRLRHAYALCMKAQFPPALITEMLWSSLHKPDGIPRVVPPAASPEEARALLREYDEFVLSREEFDAEEAQHLASRGEALDEGEDWRLPASRGAQVTDAGPLELWVDALREMAMGSGAA